MRSVSTTSRQWQLRPAASVLVNEAVDPLIRPLVGTLMTAVGLVLLVACTNLANLMLARSSGRRQETAIRLALGASRPRLLREALAETVILAIAGGVTGLAVARILILAIAGEINVGGDTMLRIGPVVDGSVLLGSLAVTMLAVLVAGLVPALQSTRADVRTALATDGPNAAAPRWRGRRILIAVQVAVSLVLLAVATLAAREVQREGRSDTGLDLERLALVQVDFTLQQYDPARAHQIVEAVLGQVVRQPNVESAAASSGLPIGIYTLGGSITAGAAAAYVELMASTPGILQTLGVPIVRGRGLDVSDTTGAHAVVVLSERTATTLFGTVDVVGHHAIFTRRRWAGMPESRPEPVTIVGVAADTDTGSQGHRDHGTAYLPLAQHDEGRLVIAARTSGDPSALVGSLRRALRSVDPEIAVLAAGTGVGLTSPSNLFFEVMAVLAGLLGSFALVLALAGLYGALTQIVSGRTREIGIRVALGADRHRVVSMVLADGLRPVAYGLVADGLFATLAHMALQPFLLRLVPRVDPFVLAIAPLLMLIAASSACYLPARRAARVEPVVALRAE
jgi:predicted permease